MKSGPAPRAASFTSQANVPVELTFTAQGAYYDAFNQVVLDALFTDPKGEVRRVPAFWAGGKTWKVRYSSGLPGVHRFRTECSFASDAGLHGISGAVTIKPYLGKNPLYIHGPVQVAPDRRHFEHADGTPFFWLGDTWWMGLSKRLPWPKGFQQLAADRKKKGFNVIQIVAGLYPDAHQFDPRADNEAGQPWEEGYSHIRPEYFDAADRKLRHLVEQGLVPFIVGAWGFYLTWMTEAQLQAHWRYLIARYAAWPVIWCAGGEANVPWYLTPNYPYDDRGFTATWTNLLRTLRATDPFHRPATTHPGALQRFSARSAVADESQLDFDLLQCIHQENESLDYGVPSVRESWAASPRMPVINGEPCYEMLGGIITSPWPRRAFWSCVLNGAMGHTYGANGIWQSNQPGYPHGCSPNGHNHGSVPWQEAMHFPGSRECAHGKRLLTRYAWEKFQPHPTGAAFSSEVWVSLAGADWIGCSRDDSPAAGTAGGRVFSTTFDAPEDRTNGRGFFRTTFELPAGQKVASARLRFAGHTYCEAQLNGAPAGFGWSCKSGSQFNDCATLLKPGRNSLTISCEHRLPGPRLGGLLAVFEIRFTNGRTQRIATDRTWKAFESKLGGWTKLDFDDTHWPAARRLGGASDAPWGPVTPPNLDWHGPQSAGITGKVRVIHVPFAEPILVRELDPGSRHRALHFNPVSGREKRLGIIQASPDGTWPCAVPHGTNHDWVLVLEAEISP